MRGEWRRILLELADHRLHVVVAVRRRAGERLVERRAEAVDVGGRAELPGAQRLGCRIRRRAEELARDRQRRVGRARDAKVGELPGAGLRAQDVRRLDVAVDDVGGVGRGERARDLDADLADRLDGERPRLDAIAQRAVRGELDDEKRRSFVLAGVVDGKDVRMHDGADRARLAHEPLAHAELASRRQDLDRDVATEHVVVRAVHGAHAALAELAGRTEAPERRQLVRARDCPCRRGGVRQRTVRHVLGVLRHVPNHDRALCR